MQLPAEVTIQPPPITFPNGTVLDRPPMTLSKINVTLIDSAWAKKCEARLYPVNGKLTLWEGAAYDEAGDYTQADVEAKVLELLGPDIKAGLEALFVPPHRVN